MPDSCPSLHSVCIPLCSRAQDVVLVSKGTAFEESLVGCANVLEVRGMGMWVVVRGVDLNEDAEPT